MSSMNGITFGDVDSEQTMTTIHRTCLSIATALINDKTIVKVAETNNNVFKALMDAVSDTEEHALEVSESQFILSPINGEPTPGPIDGETAPDAINGEITPGWLHSQRIIAAKMIGCIGTNAFGKTVDIERNVKMMEHMSNGNVRGIKRELQLVYRKMNASKLNPVELNRKLDNLKLSQFPSVMDYKMKFLDIVSNLNMVNSVDLDENLLCDKIRNYGLSNYKSQSLGAYLCRPEAITTMMKFTDSDSLFDRLLDEEQAYQMSEAFKANTKQSNETTMLTNGKNSKSNGGKGTKRHISDTNSWCRLCYIMKGEKYSHEMGTRCRMIRHVVDTVLDYSKIEKLSVSEVDTLIEKNKELVEFHRRKRREQMDEWERKKQKGE